MKKKMLLQRLYDYLLAGSILGLIAACVSIIIITYGI